MCRRAVKPKAGTGMYIKDSKNSSNTKKYYIADDLKKNKSPDESTLCGKCKITTSEIHQKFRQFHYFYQQVSQDLGGILYSMWKREFLEKSYVWQFL